jgi:hypothetical protein
MTRWVVGHREEDFSLDLGHAADVIATERPVPSRSTSTVTWDSLVMRSIQAVRLMPAPS